MRRRWLGHAARSSALLAGAFLVGLLATGAGERRRQRRAARDPRRSAATSPRRCARARDARYYRHARAPTCSRAERSRAHARGARRSRTRSTCRRVEYGALRELDRRAATAASGCTVRPGPRRPARHLRASEGPARDGGIRRGDVIVSIDGAPRRRHALRALARPDPGRGGDDRAPRRCSAPRIGKLRFTLVRQELPAPTSLVRDARAPGRQGSATCGVYSFSERHSADAPGCDARGSCGAGARGLVLDLRDNPGGLLLEAVAERLALPRRGASSAPPRARTRPRRVFEARARRRSRGIPIVVLVNRGSASASEIVAAGLARERARRRRRASARTARRRPVARARSRTARRSS